MQGAAGILTHPDGYLRAVRELCDRHDVLMIVDEVATGFGRTGRMFACEHEDVAPDLMCLAKGITGGYLPLAATLATERIYEGFLGEHQEFRTFFHGHTYTGNPLACAAAIANLNVFEQEDTIEKLQPKIELLEKLLRARRARSRRCARCASAASWSASSSRTSRSTPGWATRSRSRPAAAARSCARWATSSCSCRRWRSSTPSCAG